MTLHQELIESLQSQIQPLSPEDTMAEAGRKALLPQLISLIENEEGSRAGEDIEAVHDMRVATRRIRSGLQLLNEYYKSKPVRAHSQALRKLARALGHVRDLDVLIEGLEAFEKSKRKKVEKTAIREIIDILNSEREDARAYLVRTLDKSAYPRFLGKFAAFLTTEGAGAKSHAESETAPSQVRHLLPALIYDHLGVVRAYDHVVENADAETLHALRIEFKRLRYLVGLFSEVLGSQADGFIEEIKAIQDHLGRMNDINVAIERLNDLELEEESAAILAQYIEKLSEEAETLKAKTPDVWAHFNTKTVQRQLANAIGGL